MQVCSERGVVILGVVGDSARRNLCGSTPEDTLDVPEREGGKGDYAFRAR